MDFNERLYIVMRLYICIGIIYALLNTLLGHARVGTRAPKSTAWYYTTVLIWSWVTLWILDAVAKVITVRNNSKPTL